jgi:hypothetical protein
MIIIVGVKIVNMYGNIMTIMLDVDIIVEWLRLFLKGLATPPPPPKMLQCIENSTGTRKMLSDHLLFAVDLRGRLLSSLLCSVQRC